MICPVPRNRFTTILSIALALSLIAGCGSTDQFRLPPEADDPNVVAVFGAEILTLDEFEQEYTRSNGSLDIARADSLAEYQDFLERYVNFRLKVLAAREAGIHESPEVVGEIRTYRTTLARPYLLEEEVIEPIVRQLYERQKQIVDVSHILLRVQPGASPEDTLAAYEEMVAIRDSALQGVDFVDLAYRNSEDPSAQRMGASRGYRGRLGFFTAGRLVEPFETYAYGTAVGEISPVFRTRFGYHILKVHDKRPAVMDIRLSHIMIRPGPTAEDSAEAMELMLDMKNQLEQGADFGELAREHSDDAQSSDRGGDIGMISFETPIHESFKEPAFALQDVGDISDVVETPYGLHLIKLTDREEEKSFDESYEELKKLASRLPRTDAAEEDLAREIVAGAGGIVDTSAIVNAFEDVPPDSVFPRLVGKRLPDEILSDTVLVLGDSTYTLRDVAENTTQVPLSGSTSADIQAKTILSRFVTEAAIDFDAARLEERDEEFRRLMKEFRDGLVLFQYMEDSVWTAAERDSAALAAYYEIHADEYWWPDRTRIVSFRSRSDSLLQEVGDRLASGTSVPEMVAGFESDTLHSVTVDTTMIADSTNTVYDQGLALAQGEFTEVLPHRGAHIVLLNQGIEAARRKTYEEARTEVVNGYQKIIEERLIERLRRNYNAHTFPQRLVNAFRDGDAPAKMTSGG